MSCILRFDEQDWVLVAETHLGLIQYVNRLIKTGSKQKVPLIVNGETKHEFTLEQIRKGCALRYLEFQQYCKQARKAERSTVLFQKQNFVNPINEFPQLQKNFHLKKGPFKTAYIFMPPIKKLVESLKQLLIKTVLFDFQEIEIPKYDTLETFQKSGHIRKPDLVYLVSRFKGSQIDRLVQEGFVYKTWSNIQTSSKCTGVVTIGQCQPLWTYFEKQSLHAGNLPYKFYDIGYSLRNEGNAVFSLRRLDLFARVEAVSLFKDESSCLEYIKTYIERMKSFLDLLEFHYRILEVASWLPAIGSSNVKTYDFEAWIPQSGWLEIGNISNNGITFSKNFSVKLVGGGRPTSSCAGTGISRLLYTLIVQKGIDKARWPQVLKHLDINFKEHYLQTKKERSTSFNMPNDLDTLVND